MQCTKCGTTDAPDWITHKHGRIVESKSSRLHTIKQETYTLIYCPTCYEEEGINDI